MKPTPPRRALMVGAAVAAAAVLAALAAAPAPADDWPQFRGPRRDGKSAETGLLKKWPDGGPKLLWTADGLGTGFTHVSVAKGLVYVTGLVGKRGILRAYTTGGDLEWRADYGPEWGALYAGARSIPTVHDGLVYVAGGTGHVACFAAADGRPVWSMDAFERYQAPQVKFGWAESLLVDGENLVLTPCGRKGTMVAVNRRTGAPVWESPDLGHLSSFCSPLVTEHAGRRLIVTMTDRAVVAFAAQDGKPLWQHPYKNFRGNHPNTPIHQGGLLYIAGGYGKGAAGLELAADGGSVRQLWEEARQDPMHGQAVLVDGYVYASSHKTSAGKWSCLDLKTGRLAWESGEIGRGGSVIYADGLLYCYAEDGGVSLVRPRPDRCEVLSTFKAPLGKGPHWAHPVVSGGRLYIRHGDALMCYDIAAGAAP